MAEHRIKGHVKLRLLHDLAAGSKHQSELAKQYGVTEGRISQIKSENIDRIEAIRANAENEFSGLWIADRKNRIAEYESDVEDINESLMSSNLEKMVHPYLLSAKHRALKSAAEETGQLTTNFAAKVEYNVTGVDTERLT